MHFALTLMLGVSLSAADAPKTGTMIQTLPADGSWCTFQVTVEGDGGTVALTRTLRSVGTVFYDGEKCRYLELEQTVENGRQEIFIYTLEPTIWRFLVPESAFGEGKEPISKAVKTWVQLDQKSPIAVASLDAQDPVFAAIVRGPVGNLKAEDQPEKIHWQRGELSCDVISGNREMEFAGAKLQMTSRILRNRNIPFQLAGLRQQIKAVFGNTEYKINIKATLRDYGTDATPKLPQLTP